MSASTSTAASAIALGASSWRETTPHRLHQSPHGYKTGFTAVTGIAWSAHSLYVCEFTTEPVGIARSRQGTAVAVQWR
jgi:hypothetical protein